MIKKQAIPAEAPEAEVVEPVPQQQVQPQLISLDYSSILKWISF